MRHAANLALLSACCLFLGCATSRGLWPSASRQTTASNDVGLAGAKGLCPKEAAAACVSTAEMLERNGHLREASQLYEKARANDPSLTHLSRRLAVLYDRQGDDQHALREYKLALSLTPKDAALLNDYGYFHLQRNHFDEAEKLLNEAVAIDADNQRAWINLGLTLAKQERYNESFTAFERAVGPAAAHSNVGMLLAKAGHKEMAHRAFSRAHAIDPSLQQPQAFLAYYQKAETRPEHVALNPGTAVGAVTR